MGLMNGTDKPTLEMVIARAFAWKEGRLEVLVPAVRRLTARGMTVNEIADTLGMEQDHVRDVIEGRLNTSAKPAAMSPSPAKARSRFDELEVEPFRPTKDWNLGRLEARRGAVLGLFALGMNIDEVAETLSSTTEEVRSVLEDFQRLMPFGTTWG